MRVLLTGASGFLGAHCLRYMLAETEWEFVCPVTFRHKGVPERLTWAVDEKQWDRVDVVRHDLACPVNSSTAERFGNVELILNLASDTHPPRSVLHPVEFVQNNVNLSLYLLEYARTVKAHFVQVSTDSVYGPARVGDTHVEWDPINPNNPYSASKAAQEALAISYWRSYGLPVTIAATMNPLGETQDIEKFVPMTIGKVLRGEEVLIHATGNGEIGMRTYIDADQVAAALVWLAAPGRWMRGWDPTHPAIDRPGRWNIVGPHELDNRRVAELIAETLDLPLKMSLTKVDRPEHGHRYSMSGVKLARAGWSSDRDIEGALRRTVLWTAANPEWTR